MKGQAKKERDMKASDLRIGNLVNDQNGNLLKVIGLTTESKSLYVVDRSKFPLPKGWKDEPIPLTEEWLKRFGFENTSSFGTEYYDKGKLVICQEDGLDYIEDLTNVNIKHVHQLQNLYHALTGEELKINE